MDESDRFREPAEDVAWHDPVLVSCPRCGRQAAATADGPWAARLVCSYCTLFREWTNDELHVTVGGQPAELRKDHGAWLNPQTGEYPKHFEAVEGVDSRFGVPLWLRAECCGGHLLWANNEAHLSYLESYVAATMRERAEGPARLSWYLPAWLKQAKHRDGSCAP